MSDSRPAAISGHPGWLSAAAPTYAPLTADAEADVAIVGAGMTGIGVAYHLKLLRPDLSVVVLEGERVGFGASGRASGFIAPEVPTWMLHYRRRGAGGIERLRRWGESSQRCLMEAIEEHGIDCGLERRGVVLLAASDSEARRLRERQDAYEALAIDTEWWERDEVAERIGTRFYLAALRHPGWSLADPGRLITGLATLCRETGVRVHEKTRVLSVRDGEAVELRCGGASLRVGSVVLATNAYSPGLGFLRRKLLPIHLAVAVTRPLDRDQIEQGGWSSFPGRSEMSHRHTLRLDRDRRLLVRGDARYLFGDRIDESADAKVTARLLASLRARHPELSGVEIESAWSGAVGIVRSPLPLVGRLTANRGIHYGVGYNGYGLAGAFFAGRLLAHQIVGETCDDLDLATPIEDAGGLLREPLRSAVIKPLLYLGQRLRR